MKHSAPFACALLGASFVQAGEGRQGGLAPDEALKSIRVAPGFRVELVAHEPLVADPVSIAWDENGRAWVAEMPDYPSGPAGGRVRWLEDTDGDSLPDHSVVFAEGLPWPTSVLPHGRGVLVAAAPDVLFLEDTDGDGRADSRRVVLTGFGLGTTQLRVNGLQRGIDGRIYGANGRSGGVIRRPEDPAGRAVSIDHRDFRFDPVTFEPAAIAGPSQFGHTFDAWGRRFLSWNTVHVRQEILSPKDLERHPLLARTETLAAISDHGDSARIFPIVPPPRTFNDEPTDHFNASCGLAIEQGGTFPATHAGNAFVCEPLTGLVHRDILAPGSGPALVARRGDAGFEFLASTDPWFHPVHCRSGLDGALYVVDFYREMVEHPEYVHDDKVREKTDFTVGKGHGRIYRIVPDNGSRLRVEKLSALPAGELVARLASPNGRVRELTQRLLLERRDPAAPARLAVLARDAAAPLAAAWALWTLHALGTLEADRLLDAIGSPDPRLRESAVRIAREESTARSKLSGAVSACLADSDPGVRLQALLYLGDGSPDAGLQDLSSAARRDSSDPWASTASLAAIRGREELFLRELWSAGSGTPGRDADSLVDLSRESAELAGAACAQEREAAPAAARERALLELCTALAGRGDERAAFAIAEGFAAGLSRRGSGARLLAGWEELARTASAIAPDARRERSLRLRSARLLAHAGWDAAREPLELLLEPRNEPELQSAAAIALGFRGETGATDLLLGAWSSASPGLRQSILDALLRRPERIARVASALEDGSIAARDVDPGRRGALLRAADRDVRKRLEASLTMAGSVTGGRAELVARYRGIDPAAGDPAKGEAIYAERCSPCHRFAGKGHAVGPDLSGIGKKNRDELLVAIFDPNRSTVPGYTAYVAELDDGQILTGILSGETAGAITLRRQDGVEDGIPRASIRSLSSTGQSLMPEGLESVLAPEDVASLLRFLASGEARRD